MKLANSQNAGLAALVILLSVIIVASILVDPYAARNRAFAEFNEEYSLHPSKKLVAKPGDVALRYSAGKMIVSAIGSRTLVVNHKYEIDPARKYKLRAQIRVIVDDPAQKGARTYIGIATYDKAGNVQTSGVGAHRYGVMAGENISSEQGWIEVEGIFSGVGDVKHTQFRPGTSYIRPLLILNNKSNVAETEITEVHFELIE